MSYIWIYDVYQNARQALQAVEVEEEEEVWEIRGHLQEWVLILSTLISQKFGATGVSFDIIVN